MRLFHNLSIQSKKKHLATHSAEKFHMMINTADRPHKCDRCEFSSMHWRKLKQHEMIHTGEKPFNCNICDYAANRSAHLKEHIRSVHIKEKPYKCDQCKYRSALVGNIKKHMKKIHGGRMEQRDRDMVSLYKK